jgi:hypothetical protein
MDALGGDVRRKQEEADGDELLCAPLGQWPGEPGASEPPDHDDARQSLDPAVQAEAQQRH